MIDPKFDKKCIVFTVDAEYLKFCYLAIESLINTYNENKCLDIIIFYTDGENSATKIIENLQTERVSIRFLDISEQLKDFHPDCSILPIPTYYRIFIPKILSKYEKVLYLDVDIIVTKDISELFDLDLNGSPVGVIPDLTNKLRFTEKPNGIRDMYFNAGVLLMDIYHCKGFDLYNKCMDMIKKSSKIIGQDNAVLCCVLYGNVYQLPIEYNCPVWVLTNIKGKYTLEEMISRVGKKFSSNITEFWKDPSIIHFGGITKKVKPWYNNEGVIAFDHFWWDAASKSPFYNEFLAMREGQ